MHISFLKGEASYFSFFGIFHCFNSASAKKHFQNQGKYILGSLAFLFFHVFSYAQQYHTSSNAVSIDNESNATTGWTSPGATITSDATSPYNGSYALRVEATGTSDSSRRFEYTFTATVGQVFDVSIWAKAGSQSVDPAFAAWEGVSGFTNPTVINSGTTWTEYTFTVTATATSVVVRAYTGSGSQGATGDVLFIDAVSIVAQDSEVPTAPTLTSSGQTDTTVDLSWSGATDNVGVTGYKIYKDGTLEAPLGNVSTYQVTGLSPNTSYNFTITALDVAGNESSPSTAVPLTTNASSSGSSVWSESSGVASYTGEVAVGTSAVPNGYKLAVEGKIRSREVRVDQDNWADYVFKSDYPLLSLDEVQQYINDYGHLPNIPSAKEVKRSGLQLGEMNKLLLEKIEELTLHLIEQQQQLQKQQLEIEALQELLNKEK